MHPSGCTSVLQREGTRYLGGRADSAAMQQRLGRFGRMGPGWGRGRAVRDMSHAQLCMQAS